MSGVGALGTSVGAGVEVAVGGMGVLVGGGGLVTVDGTGVAAGAQAVNTTINNTNNIDNFAERHMGELLSCSGTNTKAAHAIREQPMDSPADQLRLALNDQA